MDAVTITVIIAILIVLYLLSCQKPTRYENFGNDVEYAPYDNRMVSYASYAPYAALTSPGCYNCAPVTHDDYDYAYITPSIGYLSRHGLLPWWNSTRDTKNMTYDIRGEIYPRAHPVGPWLNSAIRDPPLQPALLY